MKLRASAFAIIVTTAMASSLAVRVESGWLEADQADWRYFFTLVKSESVRSKVILWINGGLGCSSYQGFFGGIGPLL